MKLPLVVSLASILAFPRQPEPRLWLFDDFESRDHVAAHALAWIVLGDDLFGGPSALSLEHVAGGRSGTGHSLRLRGSVGPADTAFTGAWAPLDGRGRPVDLSAFDALRFYARGEGAFQAGLRNGTGSATANFMSPFNPGPEWKAFELPFDGLVAAGPAAAGARWQPQENHYLGITTAPGAHGPFRLELDDVALVSHRSADRLAPVARPGPPRTLRVTLSEPPAGASWTELGRDAAGDGKRPSLPDAVSVAMAGKGGDRIWFRIGLHDAPPRPWIGLNLAVDLDGDPADGTAWWGVNTLFHFDRLVTVWLFRTGDSYEGVAGEADAASVAEGEFMAGGQDVRVATVREPPALLVGVPRASLGRGAGPVRLLAAVGSALVHNDDAPDAGAFTLPR